MTSSTTFVPRNRKIIFGSSLAFYAVATSIVDYVVYASSFNDLYSEYDIPDFSIEPTYFIFLVVEALLLFLGAFLGLRGKLTSAIWLVAASLSLQVVDVFRNVVSGLGVVWIPFFSPLQYLAEVDITTFFTLADGLGFYATIVALGLFVRARVTLGSPRNRVPGYKIFPIVVASVELLVGLLLLGNADFEVSYGDGLRIYVGLGLVGLSTFMWISLPIATLAERKGRSWPLFFWLSALISPLIMIIIAAAISTQPNPQSSSVTPLGESEAKHVTSVPSQIQELGLLRDAGLLTDEEFSSKKTELLGRL
jgi:hypothetical protein